MNPSTPQAPLAALFDRFSQQAPDPLTWLPEWARDEVQRRLLALVNHVLLQEPEACARLARQRGNVARVEWRSVRFAVRATPAGLLEPASADVTPNLVLSVVDESPLALAQSVLRGVKPAVRIEGDVQLAAEVNWLVDHVRWDMEEDLARLLGDAPAHALGQFAGRVVQALRGFAGNLSPRSDKASA